MDKRSLASKYLHFHVPRLFLFIYDTRAVKGLQRVESITGRATKADGSRVADAHNALLALSTRSG